MYFWAQLQSDLVFLSFFFHCQVDSRLDSSWDSREKTVAFSFDYCYWSVDPEDPKYASQEMVSNASCPHSHPILSFITTSPGRYWDIDNMRDLLFYSAPSFSYFVCNTTVFRPLCETGAVGMQSPCLSANAHFP